MNADDRLTAARRSFMTSTAAAIVTAMHLPIDGVARAQTNVDTDEKRALIQRLRLSSNDLDAQEPFYRDILEFPTERPNATTLIIKAGQSTIEFVHDATVENRVGGAGCAFECGVVEYVLRLRTFPGTFIERVYRDRRHARPTAHRARRPRLAPD